MKINSIGSVNYINSSKKTASTNKNNPITFKGSDEFIKKDIFPKLDEIYDLLCDASCATEKNWQE